MSNKLSNSKILKIFVKASMILLASTIMILAISFKLYSYQKQDDIENMYKEAQRLEEMGDYWNAYLLYTELEDFSNSNVKAELIYPKAAMNRGIALFYSDNKFNAIPYLIDAANAGIPEAEEMLYEVIADYLNNKEN